jgi:hypothetical protein
MLNIYREIAFTLNFTELRNHFLGLVLMKNIPFFKSLSISIFITGLFVKSSMAALTFGSFSGSPIISKDNPESSGSAGLVNAGLQNTLSDGTVLLNNFSIYSSTDGDGTGFFTTNKTSARFDGIRSFNIDKSKYQITLEANYFASLFTEDNNDESTFDFAKLAVVRLLDGGTTEFIEGISFGKQSVSGNNESEAFSRFNTVQFDLEPGFYALAPSISTTTKAKGAANLEATSYATLVGNFRATPVPEPATILGSTTALGFGALLKRKSSKTKNKS